MHGIFVLMPFFYLIFLSFFLNDKGIQISTFLVVAGVYSVIARLEPRGEARSTAELYLVTKGEQIC